MAPSGVSILMTVLDKQVQQRLMFMEAALSPTGLTFFMSAEMAPYLQVRGKERFNKEGDEVSGKWAPLRPATRTARISAGYNPDHPINVRTGALEEYITGSLGTAVPSAIGATLTYPSRNASKSGRATGKGIRELEKKMRTAQRGDPKTNTVARPVLGLGSNDLAYMQTRLIRWIFGMHPTRLGG